MNRISKRLFILTLLILVVYLISSCGDQPSGIVNSPSSSEGIAQSNLNTQPDDPVVQGVAVAPVKRETPLEEALQSTTAPIKEAPTKEASTKEASTKETPATTPPAQETPEPISTVTISITGDEQKGIILEPTSIDWQDGDSVLDVLKQVTKSNRIPLEYRGSGILGYVEGIANLYEFDQGAGSGWLFKVNGQFADKSAGAVKLSKGDVVEWIYSIELIEDPEN